MRDEGVDIPDPTGDGFVIGPDSDIDPSDPTCRRRSRSAGPILEGIFGPPGGEG